MKKDDLENELRNLKFIHLTESEMAAYCDQELDQIRRARVEAHVKECFICKRQLALLQEENAALSHWNNAAFVEQRKETVQSRSANWTPLQERLSEHLLQMVASWQIYFKQVTVSDDGDKGEEVWHWQSADGLLKARAILELNADVTIHISSKEPVLEGARLKVRFGLFSQETALQTVSESEVGAKFTIPRRQRPHNMADITIENA